MRNKTRAAIAALLSISLTAGSVAQGVDYLSNQTLDQLCKAKVSPMRKDAKYPIITWGR